MDAILHGLNPDQREAVTSEAAVLQVLAPPGSGKTKTLTARVAHLVAHHHLKPWNITVCTFTVKAAREMKERITGFLGAEMAKMLNLGTFHSVSLRYLKQYGHHIGIAKDFGIADTNDSMAILKKIIKESECGLKAAMVRSRISALKAKGMDCEAFARSVKTVEQREFVHVYQEYERVLKASNLLDYDDLLLRCRFLMETFPACVKNIQAVLIDEFQDTNSIQYDLMALLAQTCRKITIVGDPDQSIYGWRSAEIKNLASMRERWSTVTINLRENYRSSGAILHAAQKLIEQDESRPPKSLVATHSRGLRPVLRKLPNALAEGDWLVAEIKRVMASTGGMLKENDFAVLLRSAAISRAVESALAKAGVPYQMLCGTRFHDRPEVKILVDYLRVINHTGNTEAVERVVNVPSRKVGDKTISGLREEAKAKNINLWNLILDHVQGRRRANTKLADAAQKGLASFVDVILTGQNKIKNFEAGTSSLLTLVDAIIKKLSYESYLKEKYPEDHEARWANVEELMAQAAEFSDKDNLAAAADEALPQIDEMDQRVTSSPDDALQLFLANAALTASSEKKADENGEALPQVTISTLHAAKGLEWPVIFVPACYDGSIPHSRAEDNDEERRLLYVGMTRAKALLYLSCPIKDTQREETTLSSFLVQPGIGSFFEEHGPMISYSSVSSIAKTLGRDAPSPVIVSENKKKLEHEEDNYWPVTGEMPLAEMAKWNRSDNALPGFGTTRPSTTFNPTAMQEGGFSTASATMKVGFQSVSSKFDELMEQSTLKRVEKRTEENIKPIDDKPKGRKKQNDGQGSIANFFSNPNGKPKQPASTPAMPSALKRPASPTPSEPQKRALVEIKNEQMVRNGGQAGFKSASLLSHKPRNAPLSTKPTQTQRGPEAVEAPPDRGYVFLSSSPAKPEKQESPPPSKPTTGVATGGGHTGVVSRPATTFHTTSMQRVAPRKTLGVKRSLNGWNSRTHK